MIVDLEEATRLLKSGNVIAVPTDTVYGIAARYDCEEAIEHIFLLKGRPQDKALTVIAESLERVSPWVVPEKRALFEQLAKRWWPGALTLVVETLEGVVSDRVRRGSVETGLRVPNHPELLTLLQKAGPLVNPSANLSGQPPATSAEEVEAIFGKDFPVLGSDRSGLGKASTVVRLLDDGVRVLREGSVEL